MTGIARAARWAAGALAGLGVRDLAGVLVVVLIVVAALCWVLADEDRSRRLAGILGAWRGARPHAVGQSTGKAPGGRRGRGGRFRAAGAAGRRGRGRRVIQRVITRSGGLSYGNWFSRFSSAAPPAQPGAQGGSPVWRLLSAGRREDL